MNFTTTSKEGRIISVSGTPQKFIMYCNFLVNKEEGFWDNLGKEFEKSLKQVSFDHGGIASTLVFNGESRNANEIMEVIIKLFEDNVQ